MTYYRIAIYDRHMHVWIWKTTALTSLHAVVRLLRSYSALQDRIRVFTAASKEELQEMLRCENANQVSGSATATQFLQARMLLVPGQTSSAYGTEEPAVRQVTAVATEILRREQSLITGFPGFGSTNSLERKRLELEYGPGGDHDTSYRFTLPISTPQLLAWARLQSRVQAGELEP